MKIVCVLLTAVSLHLPARGFSQGITVTLQNAPLESFFKVIEQQSDFSFVYSKEAMEQSKPVSIEVKNENLEKVLKTVFASQPLSYSFNEKFIIIKIAEKKKDSLIEVRGRVINESGEAIPRATVFAKLSNKGISTNERGEFVLSDINDDDILTITSVGYYKEEIYVNKETAFVIRLRVAVGILDETIVIAYGTTTRKLNTGSVGKVSSIEISKQPVSNPLAALQGRVPGLLITQGNGLPGSNFTVRIRGRNSIQNGNSPFYIIDGVPFANDADLLTQRSQVNASSPFNTIDPSEIESIEVLKDADATAIYGSRGANGVILITTKRGKAGKTNLDIKMRTGWGKVTRTMDFLHTPQYLEMRHEAFANDARTPTAATAYDLLVWDTTRYTDFKELLIGETARTNNISIQLSGGTSNTRFSLNGNYYDESTVFPTDAGTKRISVSPGFYHTSSDNKLDVSVKASYASDHSDLITQDMTQFINLAPVLPALYDSPGRLKYREGGFSFVNPLASFLRTYEVVTDRLTANALIQYNILKPLRLKINLGYNNLYADEVSLTPIASQDPFFNPTGSAFFGTNRAQTWIIEPQAEAKFRLLGKGKIFVLGGTTFQQNSSKTTSLNGSGYTNDDLLNSISGAQTVTARNGYQLYKYQAIFGRISFNWDEKYLLNANARRDGSSRFGPGKQFANFYSIAGAWIFSNERYLKENLKLLSYGKIRISYGTSGNDLIGNYQYLDTYSPTQYPYQGTPSFFPTRLFNSDYSWEQINKLDIGLELGLFKDRMLVTADWFKHKSDNQIIFYMLPGQTGFNNVLRNFPGVVGNSGIEIQLTTVNLKNKEFSWTTSFNISHIKNKLLEFPGLETTSYARSYIIGKPLNSVIGSTYLNVDPATGVYQFLNKNKQPTFSPTTDDYSYAGTTDPKFFGGLQNNLTYKNWAFQFFFEFRNQEGTHPIYGTSSLVGPMINQPTGVLNRWRKPGEIQEYQKYTQTIGPAFNASNAIVNSDARITDASYIRLKNLSLSYSLPAAMLKKTGIENLEFFTEAQNLFVITNFKGPDPETQRPTVLPPLRIVTVGLLMKL